MKKILTIIILIIITTIEVSSQNLGRNNSDKKRNGLITYYSNQNGEYNIFVMNSDGSNQRQMTKDTTKNICGNWSPDGSMMVFLSNRDGNMEIYLMAADGSNQRRLTNNSTPESHVQWSPDSKKIVYLSNTDGNQEIYTLNIDGRNMTNLTYTTNNEMFPCWSPDGKTILFSSDKEGGWKIYQMNSDGTDQKRLTKTDTHLWELYPVWSPKGSKISYFTHEPKTRISNIHVMDDNGENSKQLTFSNHVDEDPSWSPDGNFIVFQSNRNGNYQIFTMKSDGTEQKCISNNKNSEYWASWSWIKEL